MTIEELWGMKLHEHRAFWTDTLEVHVLRVSGGWLYQLPSAPPVFVPLDNELMQRDQVQS